MNNISHEGTHNLNPRVGKTKVIEVAANNIGHKVTNNLKPSHTGKTRKNLLYGMQKHWNE